MMGETYGSRVDRLHSEILRIWERLLESSDLSIDDDFFDKGGDSLLATELMLELRQLTGKALPDSLLFESSTVRALAQRLSEKEAPQRKVAVRVGAASDDAKPLLFFHGDWTRGGFYVEHLARKLGSEISLIAVAPHGPGGEPIPPSIEEMAADRLPAILEAQPTGPYRLAGHCVGGIVALETARLLMKLNHQVETVVMIDSPHPSMTRIVCRHQSDRGEPRHPVHLSRLHVPPPQGGGQVQVGLAACEVLDRMADADDRRGGLKDASGAWGRGRSSARPCAGVRRHNHSTSYSRRGLGV